MYTNRDFLKETVNDDKKLKDFLMTNVGLTIEAMTGVCDTSNCPYMDKCHEEEKEFGCQLKDSELIDIWLNMEHK